MTENNTLQPEAPRLGSLRRFEQLITEDLANPKFYDFVNDWGQQSPPVSKVPLVVATIASDYLNLCLAQNCNIVRLLPNDFENQLAKNDVDFVLMETSWLYADPQWATLIRRAINSKKNNPLFELLGTCQSQGGRRPIPTVLWFTQDKLHIDSFAHLVDRFDHVFAAMPGMAMALGDYTTKPIGNLPPAVEPTFHNPMMNDDRGAQSDRDKFFICSDSYHELSSFDANSNVQNLLDPALDYIFWLFETRYRMRNNNARVPKNFRRRFVGCFDEAERSVFLKLSDFYLAMVNDPGELGYHHYRNILESMASKSLVLTNLEQSVDLIDPYLFPITSDRDLRDALAGLTGDPHLGRRMRHLAYRHVLENHSYLDRLRSICEVIDIRPGRIGVVGNPRVTAIVPTMRPELLPFVLEGYRQQTYANLELVIVLHSDHSSPKDIMPLLREEDYARVVHVPSDQAVGAALNTGIDYSDGSYWCRIDDDDYYGPNYFRDMMLNRKISDFDICGKSQWFIYFEEFSQIQVHKKDWAAHSSNPAIAGGTFVVRNAGDGSLRFDDKVRGYADVDFIGREIDRGGKLVSSDPFNFLQIRRNDRTSHTWTADASSINTAETISNGIDLSAIAI